MEIPRSLWHERKILMPACLASALRAELAGRNLYDAACAPQPAEKEVVGGKGEQATVEHFTHRFKTSAVRVQFVVLNPNGTFEPHATDLRGCLLDGRVALLDLACGAGGGLLGLLSTVAELRSQSCHPRLPLDLGILAGDCSAEALALHAGMLGRVSPHLEAVGMRLRWRHVDWDVAKPLSTTALVDRWFEFCPGAEEYVAFISAFSDFTAKHTEVVLEAVKDVAKRLHDKPFLVAWIEPATNKSERVLPKVWGVLAGLFGGATKGKGAEPSEEFDYLHPFTGDQLRGRARVLPWGKGSG